MVTFDDPEASLWRPLGSRRIKHVVSNDTLDDLNKKGIEYVLVHPRKLPERFGRSVDQWLVEIGGHVVQTIPLKLRAQEPLADWLLVRVKEAPAAK